MKKNKLPVWDRLQRTLHWSLALLIVPAWLSGGTTGATHERLGYCTVIIVAVRIWWGFQGSRYARFAQFIRAPRATLRYLRGAASGRALRYLGHNPLGGWMVLALMGCVLALGLSGWLFTTDWLWGYGWLMDIHNALTWLLGGLVVLHVGGVIFTGRQHRENLLYAMFSGSKRAPDKGDIG